MKFGSRPIKQCVGAILAHSQNGIAKGTQLHDDHISALEAEGHSHLTVALLEKDDVDENTAAQRLAQSLCSHHIEAKSAHTGRVNLYATQRGLYCANSTMVNTLNAADEGVTLATLPDMTEVEPGTMVATLKIIPFAISAKALNTALEATTTSVMDVHPYKSTKVLLLFTKTAATTDKALEKAMVVTKKRLAHYEATLIATHIVPHDEDSITPCLISDEGHHADIILILGAAATIDRGDVIPQAIIAAGGDILRHGMPVDPGNLLLLAECHGIPVIGLPGCAKSPARNGLDHALDRLMAGLPVTSLDLMSMGVGGLLKETRRGLPREARTEPSSMPPSKPMVAGVLMAAGTSSRMGADNKLLKEWQNTPLIRHALNTLTDAQLDHILVVTGHEADQIAATLPITTPLAHNPHYGEGMSTSIKTAIRALPANIDAVLIMLADMPDINSSTLDRLIKALPDHPDALALVPTWQGKRGNPVIWRKEGFAMLMTLEGDQGARQIMLAQGDRVIDIEVDDSAILLDVDTEVALQALGNKA